MTVYCLGSLGIYKYKGPEYIENRKEGHFSKHHPECGPTQSSFPSGKLRTLVLRSRHVYTSTCIFPECQEYRVIGVKSSPEKPFLICSKHYAVLNCQLNTPQPCASCDVLPKQGTCTCFTRHSPDVIVINDLLSQLKCDDNAVHLIKRK